MKPNRSAIPRSRAPCATSASRSMMPSPLPNRWMCERRGQGVGSARTSYAALTRHGRYTPTSGNIKRVQRLLLWAITGRFLPLSKEREIV
jgi:hypothetical protein